MSQIISYHGSIAGCKGRNGYVWPESTLAYFSSSLSSPVAISETWENQKAESPDVVPTTVCQVTSFDGLVATGNLSRAYLKTGGVNVAPFVSKLSAFTISMWIQSRALNRSQETFYAENNGLRFQFANAGGRYVEYLAVRTEGGLHPETFSGATSIGTEWTHVACSIGAAGGKVYVNGVLDGSDISAVITNNTVSSCIFMAEDTSGTDSLYGCLDNAAFFNEQLSDDEILALYTATIRTEIDPFWYLSSTLTGSVAPLGTWDSSINSLRAPTTTLYHNAYVTEAVGLTCLTGDSGNLPSNDYIYRKSNFSMSAWVKRSETSSGNRGIYSETESGNTPIFLFTMWDGILKAGFRHASTTAYETADSTTVIGDAWTHVSMTFDWKVGFKCYVNGVQEGFNARTAIPAQTVAYRVVGAQGRNGIWPLQGTMDEFKQWQRTLSNDEILAEKNRYTPTA